MFTIKNVSNETPPLTLSVVSTDHKADTFSRFCATLGCSSDFAKGTEIVKMVADIGQSELDLKKSSYRAKVQPPVCKLSWLNRLGGERERKRSAEEIELQIKSTLYSFWTQSFLPTAEQRKSIDRICSLFYLSPCKEQLKIVDREILRLIVGEESLQPTKAQSALLHFFETKCGSSNHQKMHCVRLLVELGRKEQALKIYQTLPRGGKLWNFALTLCEEAYKKERSRDTIEKTEIDDLEQTKLQFIKDLLCAKGSHENLEIALQIASELPSTKNSECILKIGSLLKRELITQKECEELDRLVSSLTKSLSFFYQGLLSSPNAAYHFARVQPTHLSLKHYICAASRGSVDAKVTLERYYRESREPLAYEKAHELAKELESLVATPYYTFQVMKDYFLGLGTSLDLEKARAKEQALYLDDRVEESMLEEISLVTQIARLLDRDSIKPSKCQLLDEKIKALLGEDSLLLFYKSFYGKSISSLYHLPRSIELLGGPCQRIAYEKAHAMGSIDAKVLLEKRYRDLYSKEWQADQHAHQLAKELEEEMGSLYTLRIVEDCFSGFGTAVDLEQAGLRANLLVESSEGPIRERALHYQSAIKILQKIPFTITLYDLYNLKFSLESLYEGERYFEVIESLCEASLAAAFFLKGDMESASRANLPVEEIQRAESMLRSKAKRPIKRE